MSFAEKINAAEDVVPAENAVPAIAPSVRTDSGDANGAATNFSAENGARAALAAEKTVALPENFSLPGNFSPAQLDSRVASALRFPLIALIVVIHVTVVAPAEFPTAHATIALFQNVLTRLAVPLFFFISGYFYFFKTENFDGAAWRKKTRSRVKTLLVPYLVWNAISAVQFFLRWQFLPENAAADAAVPAGTPTLAERGADFLQWLAVFRGGTPENAVATDVPALGFLFAAVAGTPLDGEALPRPLVGQFWFVRDLFVVGLFSFAWFPILKNRVAAPLFLAAAGALWLALGNDIHVNAQFMTPGIFFFCLGAFFAIRKIGFATAALSVRVPATVVAAALAFVDWRWNALGFGDGNAWHAAVHSAWILVGATALVAWFAAGTCAGRVGENRFLAASVFFVFGMHAPASRLFEATLLPLFPQASSAQILAAFAAFAAFALAFSLLAFALVSRFAPILLVPLAGGRGNAKKTRENLPSKPRESTR